MEWERDKHERKMASTPGDEAAGLALIGRPATTRGGGACGCADADVETRRLAKCLMLLADATDMFRSSVEANPDCRPYVEILAWRENRNLAARIEAIALARLPFGYAANELKIDRETSAATISHFSTTGIGWTIETTLSAIASRRNCAAAIRRRPAGGRP